MTFPLRGRAKSAEFQAMFYLSISSDASIIECFTLLLHIFTEECHG